jgi:hypothetical protein
VVAVFVLVAIASFVASCVWWGLSMRRAAPAAATPVPQATAAILVILGAIEVCFGIGAFLMLAATILAGAAYLGVGPLALPALLFAAWGVFLGFRLIVRRTAQACRSAAFWYLPIALFFAAGCAFELQHRNLQTLELLFASLAFLGIFTIMIVPLVPGLPRNPARFAGSSTPGTQSN